jgi:outer membrane murein-binding lipoprotein Lpp
MVRRENMETNGTMQAIAGLQAQKAQIRADIRQALAAWKSAQHQMTFGLDAEGRIAEIERKLRAKIATMNGLVSEINASIATYRDIHKERARRYAAEMEAMRRMRRGDRGVAE